MVGVLLCCDNNVVLGRKILSLVENLSCSQVWQNVKLEILFYVPLNKYNFIVIDDDFFFNQISGSLSKHQLLTVILEFVMTPK